MRKQILLPNPYSPQCLNQAWLRLLLLRPLRVLPPQLLLSRKKRRARG
jgi:hypothetical protein